MEEPSVLDYVKSKLRLRGGPSLEIPPEVVTEAPPPEQAPILPITDQPPEPIQVEPEPSEIQSPKSIPGLPWRSLTALGLALLAQWSMRPSPDRDWMPGFILLVFAFAMLAWANLSKEWRATALPPIISERLPFKFDLIKFSFGLVLSLSAFFIFSFGVLKFTILNLGLLLTGLGFVIAAFWAPTRRPVDRRLPELSAPFSRRTWTFSLFISTLSVLAAIGLVAFFRFYRLGQVPPEMNSDHAEKILDIMRVLAGNTMIFFPTNGGREALQFYLAAFLVRFFGFKLDFMLLKLVTSVVGFLSLPFIYLLGKEIGSRRVGMLAFLFAGIAYWPNVVSRFGLRLPFYILFSASTLYFLLHGIRTARQNDFVLAGVSLGLSFYGYSADRILPLLVLLAVGLFLVHSQSTGRRQHTIIAAIALIVISLVIFLPLLSYILAEPSNFLFRTLTRMGSLERPISEPIWLIFIKNMGRALAMFSWDDGEVWPISIPHSPALDVVTGALFYMGAGLLFLRYLRKRNWLDLFLLLSIPVFMLPSVMALAFPAENPNLYRTGGAMVPVFLMVAIALDGLMTGISSRMGSQSGSRYAWILVILLLFVSAVQNYGLVFKDYYQQYRLSAWNTSEMGAVARDFIDSVGGPDNVWVMGYPYWVDTRLVAVNAGYPGKDYELFVDGLDGTLDVPGPKLFLLNPQDQEAIQALTDIYPQGWFETYTSRVETKDFLIFFVSPKGDN
jgi:hypothetical protein